MATCNASIKCKTFSQPLEVGSSISCRWRDGKLHLAKILKARKLNANSNDYQYYVHYNNFDRRLDEWVDLDQLELEFVKENLDERHEDKTRGQKRTRYQNRIQTQLESELSHAWLHVEEGHEMFHAKAVQAYEELTKMKNINKIELGRYEIETWYFSPFPPEYHNCEKLFFVSFALHF